MRDALGPALPSLIAGQGGSVTDVRHIRDRPSGLLAAAVREPPDTDVVVVTGSTSVGSTDQLRRLLQAGGAEAIVDTVACPPGHPQLSARLGPNAGWWACRAIRTPRSSPRTPSSRPCWRA